MRLQKNLKPIHKFNGGIGATLCYNCSVIIDTGLTDNLYCDQCRKNYLRSDDFVKDFSDAVTRDTWENLNHKQVLQQTKQYVNSIME